MMTRKVMRTAAGAAVFASALMGVCTGVLLWSIASIPADSAAVATQEQWKATFDLWWRAWLMSFVAALLWGAPSWFLRRSAA